MSFNINEHNTPEKLERYSFLWSEARLLIAALALFLGGVPPISLILGAPYGLVGSILTLSWIISGVAAVYLLYQWNKRGRNLFGGKVKMDLYAFGVMVVSGINLGLAPILNNNIGMNIFPSKLMFVVGGVLYLASAYHLQKRWKANGEKLF